MGIFSPYQGPACSSMVELPTEGLVVGGSIPPMPRYISLNDVSKTAANRHPVRLVATYSFSRLRRCSVMLVWTPTTRGAAYSRASGDALETYGIRSERLCSISRIARTYTVARRVRATDATAACRIWKTRGPNTGTGCQRRECRGHPSPERCNDRVWSSASPNYRRRVRQYGAYRYCCNYPREHAHAQRPVSR